MNADTKRERVMQNRYVVSTIIEDISRSSGDGSGRSSSNSSNNNNINNNSSNILGGTVNKQTTYLITPQRSSVRTTNAFCRMD